MDWGFEADNQVPIRNRECTLSGCINFFNAACEWVTSFQKDLEQYVFLRAVRQNMVGVQPELFRDCGFAGQLIIGVPRFEIRRRELVRTESPINRSKRLCCLETRVLTRRSLSLANALTEGYLPVEISSGNCTRMNRRTPPQSSLSSATACPVVPLPAKKSSTISPSSVTCSHNVLITFTGFGKSKTDSPKRASSSLVPSVVYPTSRTVEKPVKSLFKSFLKRFNRGLPEGFSGHKIRPSSISCFIRFGSKAHPRASKGGYAMPVSGLTMS